MLSSYSLICSLIYLFFIGSVANGESENSYKRLPNNTIPLSYYVSITTYLHEGDTSFFGFVEIRILGQQDSREVWLHSRGLKDIEVNLKDLYDNRRFENLPISTVEDGDFLVISAPENVGFLQGNEYLLTVSFTGLFSKQFLGFYATHFEDSQNRQVVLAATQFEGSFARQAFPCYDEPHLKAKFKIALTHSNTFKSYSNMPQDGPVFAIPDSHMAITKFKETPPLPTYNVAFMITNYYQEYDVNSTSSCNQRIIYKQENTTENLEPLADFIGDIFESMEAFFGPLSNLPKLDHLAIPNALPAGMENWGLIIYNEDYLKINGEVQPSLKLASYSTIAHEIAHQWFGNLITAKWWNNVWITEALATFYSWRFFDMVVPNTDILDYSISTLYDYALLNPPMKPLSRYLQNKEMSNLELNDYFKGCAIFKMIENVLSKETTDKAIKSLLSKYGYSNFDEDDFIAELQEAATSDKNQFFERPNSVEMVFKSWFYNIGFPIVTLTRSYSTGAITISQKSNDEFSTELWYIPLNFATSAEADFNDTSVEYILPKVSKLRLQASGKLMLNKNEWIIVNKQQTGHYVVNYDLKNWKIIADILQRNHWVIHKYNRAQILRDVVILLERELIPIETILDLVSYIEDEVDLTVWRSGTGILSYLKLCLENGKSSEQYLEFVRRMVEHVLQDIGLERDPEETLFRSEVRNGILELACSVNEPSCIEFTAREFLTFLNGEGMSDNLPASLIISYGLKFADEETFMLATEMLLKRKDRRIEDYLIIGLVQNDNPNNFKYLLNQTIEKDVASQWSSLEYKIFTSYIVKSNFTELSEYFHNLDKDRKDSLINAIFEHFKIDKIDFDFFASDLSCVNITKKIFHAKMFNLFVIAQENNEVPVGYGLENIFEDKFLTWLSMFENTTMINEEFEVESNTMEVQNSDGENDDDEKKSEGSEDNENDDDDNDSEGGEDDDENELEESETEPNEEDPTSTTNILKGLSTLVFIVLPLIVLV